MILLAGVAGCILSSPARAAVETVSMPMEEFRDRLKGGWAGQMIGVSYGSIYEFRSLGQPITGELREWKPEFVSNSIHQDDLYVEMTFLKSLETHGIQPTPRQIGTDFRDSRYPLWHANFAARENLQQGIMPPMSGHPRYNPHADDIDFQIEADLFGLITPGMPRASGRFSDLFGSIMNYGDGVYGGRFVSAMYSQAYLEKEPTPAAIDRCIRAGLASLPAKSEYAQIIRDVIDGYRRHPDDWLATWKLIEDRWGDDDLCPEGHRRPFNIDAKLNGAYIAIGLLYGRGDFAKTLEISTRCGQDADCNPSNAAGILGTIYGYSKIPRIYTSGIPALAGRKFDYTDYDFPRLIDACERMARKVVAENGGRITGSGSDERLILPVQSPQPPEKLEQMDRFPPEQLGKWSQDFVERLGKAQVSRIRRNMNRWSPGWRLVASGWEMNPGIGAFLGRENVLTTHPVNESTPAVLERKVTVRRRNPRLNLLVASFPGDPGADWTLRVKVNGVLLDERIVHSPGKWETIRLDLSPYAGKSVTLRLENAAGGERRWAWEAAYWGPVEVTGE
ncbi:MAG: ADP-ribosylglycohydrolase family protein [Armatimonadetes bacterium]|nr:ADP-ribosylglycohydrolase family protein [Armatimonadota bacterium]